MGQAGHGGSPDVTADAHLNDLLKPLSDLIILLGTELTESKRQEVVTQFHPEDAPPAYVKSVARYFEQLSRIYKKTPSEVPQKP